MFNPHVKFEMSTNYDYLQRRNERQRQNVKIVVLSGMQPSFDELNSAGFIYGSMESVLSTSY